MTHEDFERFLLEFPGVTVDYSFDKETVAYRYGEGEDSQIVAFVAKESQPLRVSLKCDPQLARNLREKYETVLPGQNLHKKYWNTIICSGQLSSDEVFDLARLSYRLASGEQVAS